MTAERGVFSGFQLPVDTFSRGVGRLQLENGLELWYKFNTGGEKI